jgi:hypothetical protein
MEMKIAVSRRQTAHHTIACIFFTVSHSSDANKGGVKIEVANIVAKPSKPPVDATVLRVLRTLKMNDIVGFIFRSA